MDTAKLQAELEKPEYADLVASGDTDAVARLLNAPTKADIARPTIEAAALLAAIDADEFLALDDAAIRRLSLTLTIVKERGSVSADSPWLAALRKLFSKAPRTTDALQAASTKKATLGEGLFGAGAMVSHDDVALALGPKGHVETKDDNGEITVDVSPIEVK